MDPEKAGPLRFKCVAWVGVVLDELVAPFRYQLEVTQVPLNILSSNLFRD